ncbi:MAG: hypothetical protein N3B18_07710 [Desulfobacterota bacterium]|nr:hypothetical protein [Thermodesulfobacteriota bacterium]
MGKKAFTVLLAAACLVALAAAPARAAKEQGAIENILLSLQEDLQAADPSGQLDPLTINTLVLLDELRCALKADDRARVQTLVQDYVASISTMQETQPDFSCMFPLLMSLFGSTTTMLTTAAAGGDTACMVLKLTNSIADIISAVQTYRICVIDNAETPDQTARDEIVRRQVIVKTYNFITNALYTGLCKENPTFFDWLNVFFDFLGIFPKQPAETEQQ